ncbi:MAG TPA: TetR/AcrR family transcriptional regulator [Terriglobales bacterium]
MSGRTRKAMKALEPQQARSRESLRKLLQAAAEVMGQHGLEGATIPRIARHAGLTPGSVYRRFHDKEALFEAAILEILERQDEQMRTGMTPLIATPIPLAAFVDQAITGMVVTYRAKAPLLRAMRQFVHNRTGTPFGRKVTALDLRYFKRVVDVFMTHRDEIRHPQPRLAVSFAIKMVVGTLFQLVVLPTDMSAWRGLLPKDDHALKQELTRAFLNYLDVAKTSKT